MGMADNIADGRNTRSNVAMVVGMLDDFHARRIPIPPELAAAIPVVVARLMRSDSARIQAAGVKLALAALRHNLETVAVADRIARADAADPAAVSAGAAPIKFIEGLPPDVFTK